MRRFIAAFCIGCSPQSAIPPQSPESDVVARATPKAEKEPQLTTVMERLTLSFGYDPTPPKSVSPGEIAEDVELMLYTLRHAWGGYAFVERPLIEAAEARLGSIPRTLGEAPPAALCEALAEALLPLPDAHFAVSLDGHGQCGPLDVRTPMVGKNVGAGDPRPWKWSMREVAGKPVGVLAVTRFRQSGDPGWNGMLEAIDAATTRAVIIDLRGNSGGNDTTAYWIAQALSGSFVRRTGVTVVRNQHPLALTLMMNFAIVQARGSIDPPAHLVDLHDQLADLRTAVLDGREPSRLEAPVGPNEGLDRAFAGKPGPLVILVDARCGSSCENALHLLRTLPGATVFGENTAGAIHFGQGGRLVLPHSRIEVVVATQFNRYEDGTFREKVGFEPDQRVEPGSDAMDAAEAWLAETL